MFSPKIDFIYTIDLHLHFALGYFKPSHEASKLVKFPTHPKKKNGNT